MTLPNDPLFSVPILIQEKNGLPAIEIRKLTTDIPTVKAVISCAFRDQPIIILPCFTDKLKSISAMIGKGIIYAKGGKYYFTF